MSYQMLCWVWLGVSGVLVYGLVTLIVMELSIKNINGEIVYEEDNWVIQELYRFNFANSPKKFPESLCQLYRGLLWSWPFALWLVLVGIFGLTIIYFIILPFCGVLPKRPKKLFKSIIELEQIELTVFLNSYEKIGDKKWIAPWKIVACLICFYISWKIGTAISTIKLETVSATTKDFWQSAKPAVIFLAHVGITIIVIIGGTSLLCEINTAVTKIKTRVKNSATYRLVLGLKHRFCPTLTRIPSKK